ATLLWVGVRDSNAWLAVLAAPFLFATGFVRGFPRVPLVAVAVCLSCTFLASHAAARARQRDLMPLIHVIEQRFPPHAQRTAPLGRSGMPATPAVVALAGHFSFDTESAIFSEPALEPFRHWLVERGSSSYLRFLVLHPAVAFLWPIRYSRYLLDANVGMY